MKINTLTKKVAIGKIVAVSLALGVSCAVEIPVAVADGYHVQANPASGEFLIPLELKLGSTTDLECGLPQYPPAEKFRLLGTTEDLLTYGDSIIVTIMITATTR